MGDKHIPQPAGVSENYYTREAGKLLTIGKLKEIIAKEQAGGYMKDDDVISVIVQGSPMVVAAVERLTYTPPSILPAKELRCSIGWGGPAAFTNKESTASLERVALAKPNYLDPADNTVKPALQDADGYYYMRPPVHGAQRPTFEQEQAPYIEPEKA